VAPRDEIITAADLPRRLASLEGWHGDTTAISKAYAVGYDTAIRIVEQIGQAAIRAAAPAQTSTSGGTG
jgi:4a-hydroxytetrahydrobiopterin dehydratase